MNHTRVLCYTCTASELVRERLWRVIQCDAHALLIDPTLETMPGQDYVL